MSPAASNSANMSKDHQMQPSPTSPSLGPTIAPTALHRDYPFREHTICR